MTFTCDLELNSRELVGDEESDFNAIDELQREIIYHHKSALFVAEAACHAHSFAIKKKRDNAKQTRDHRQMRIDFVLELEETFRQGMRKAEHGKRRLIWANVNGKHLVATRTSEGESSRPALSTITTFARKR